MTSQDDDFVWWDKGSGLGFHWYRNSNWKDTPLVVWNIILLNRIDASTSFITTEDVDVWLFKYNCWHGTSILVQICNSFPPIQVDWISFTRVKDSIHRSSSNGIDIVALMSQCMSVSAHVKCRLFYCTFWISIIHIHCTRYVGEARVETTCDQNVSISQSNCSWIWFEDQVWWYFLSCPEISCKIIVQNKIMVIRVTKEIGFLEWFILLIEEFECILIWKLDICVF